MGRDYGLAEINVTSPAFGYFYCKSEEFKMIDDFVLVRTMLFVLENEAFNCQISGLAQLVIYNFLAFVIFLVNLRSDAL